MTSSGFGILGKKPINLVFLSFDEKPTCSADSSESRTTTWRCNLKGEKTSPCIRNGFIFRDSAVEFKGDSPESTATATTDDATDAERDQTMRRNSESSEKFTRPAPNTTPVPYYSARQPTKVFRLGGKPTTQPMPRPFPGQSPFSESRISPEIRIPPSLLSARTALLKPREPCIGLRRTTNCIRTGAENNKPNDEDDAKTTDHHQPPPPPLVFCGSRRPSTGAAAGGKASVSSLGLLEVNWRIRRDSKSLKETHGVVNSFADPFRGCSANFHRRLSEMSTLVAQTVQWEKRAQAKSNNAKCRSRTKDGQ